MRVRRRETPVVSVYQLKPKFQNLLRPLTAALASAGVTANQVTVAAALISIAEGAAIWASNGANWALFLLPPVLLVRMALNAVDGMLAREFAHKSRLGAMLNELGDVISDIALYLPFAAIAGVSAILVGLVVAIAAATEAAGLAALQIGAPRRYDGPFGKSDRAVFFSALALALAAGIEPGRWTSGVLIAGAALGLLTIVRRVRAALGKP